LERIGTPPARTALAEFARQTAKDELSREAAAAVRRLDRRGAGTAPPARP
jgi:hypothetical protein